MSDSYCEAVEFSAREAEPASSSPNPENALPAYMKEVYDWAYVDPKKVRWLDRNFVVRTLLFLNDRRLMRAYLDRIRPGMRVWQLAHVYGDLVSRAASKVGQGGAFHLTDITPIQLEHASSKIGHLPWARVIRQDAANFPGEGEAYALICSFFLLHEVPEAWKHAIVKNVLDRLPEGGEALFVDYHKPAWWQPIGYLLRLVNAWLEPFAKAMWTHEIRDYAPEPERFSWNKRTVFGGVYQILSVVRRKA